MPFPILVLLLLVAGGASAFEAHVSLYRDAQCLTAPAVAPVKVEQDVCSGELDVSIGDDSFQGRVRVECDTSNFGSQFDLEVFEADSCDGEADYTASGASGPKTCFDLGLDSSLYARVVCSTSYARVTGFSSAACQGNPSSFTVPNGACLNNYRRKGSGLVQCLGNSSDSEWTFTNFAGRDCATAFQQYAGAGTGCFDNFVTVDCGAPAPSGGGGGGVSTTVVLLAVGLGAVALVLGGLAVCQSRRRKSASAEGQQYRAMPSGAGAYVPPPAAQY